MLELYQFEECPYCGKVRAKMTDLQLDFIARAAGRGGTNREMVKKISGQTKVPVLVDGDKVIVDSDKIIEYLEKNYGEK